MVQVPTSFCDWGLDGFGDGSRNSIPNFVFFELFIRNLVMSMLCPTLKDVESSAKRRHVQARPHKEAAEKQQPQSLLILHITRLLNHHRPTLHRNLTIQ